MRALQSMYLRLPRFVLQFFNLIQTTLINFLRFYIITNNNYAVYLHIEFEDCRDQLVRVWMSPHPLAELHSVEHRAPDMCVSHIVCRSAVVRALVFNLARDLIEAHLPAIQHSGRDWIHCVVHERELRAASADAIPIALKFYLRASQSVTRPTYTASQRCAVAHWSASKIRRGDTSNAECAAGAWHTAMREILPLLSSARDQIDEDGFADDALSACLFHECGLPAYTASNWICAANARMNWRTSEHVHVFPDMFLSLPFTL